MWVYIWTLCVLKIPSILKDASSENNTLAGKRGSVANFTRYHCAKAIWKANNLFAVSGHTAHKSNACRVLDESSRLLNGKPRLLTPDIPYSCFEFSTSAAAHPVPWSEPLLFLAATCQIFEMNLSQLTSRAGLQKIMSGSTSCRIWFRVKALCS